MRNSTRKHNRSKVSSTSATQPRSPLYRPNLPLPLVILTTLLLMVPQPRASGDDQGFRFSQEDMVSIRADTGWEDIEPDIVHFEGHFEMRVRDWLVLADRATLYGKLDDPDHLVLEGSPASMQLTYTLGERTKIVQGQAQKITYDRESAQIRLSGDARIGEGDKILHSDEIDYDISTDRFRTQGATGINVRVDGEKP